MLCGASHLHIHDLEDQNVHPDPAEVREQERNLYIKTILEGGGWSCPELLDVTSAILKLHSSFAPDTLPRLLELSMRTSISPEQDRSLIQEFVNHDHWCFLSRERSSDPRLCPLISLQELYEMLENNLTDNEGWTDLCFEEENLFAEFRLDAQGRTVIADRVTKLPAIGEFNNISLGTILKIEELKIRRNKEETIIVVKKYKSDNNICDKLDNLDLNDEEDNNYHVLAKSQIFRVPQSQDLFFFLLCDNSFEEKVVLKTRNVDKYFMIHPGQSFNVSNTSLHLLDNEVISVCPYFGRHPVFDIGCEEVRIQKQDRNIKTLDRSSFYDIRHLDLIPLEEPVNMVATVNEVRRDTDTHKWTIVLASSIRAAETIHLFLSPPQTDFGWVPGLKFKIFSVVKVMSKKHNPYFISTVMTSAAPVEDDDVKEVIECDPETLRLTFSSSGPCTLDTLAMVEAVLSVQVGGLISD